MAALEECDHKDSNTHKWKGKACVAYMLTSQGALSAINKLLVLQVYSQVLEILVESLD